MNRRPWFLVPLVGGLVLTAGVFIGFAAVGGHIVER